MRHLFLAAAATIGAVAAAPVAAEFKSDRITVTSEGSGPDVILIPGLTSSPRIWKPTAAAIPGYRYHFVQVRGFAGTEPGANQSGDVAAPVAEEIARYIGEEKLTRPAVIGHSMGGSIGMMLAARHPEAVGKLMIVDMPPFVGAFIAGPNATAAQLKPMAAGIRQQLGGAAPLTPEQDAKREAAITAMIGAMVATDSERAGPVADAKASNARTVANAYAELIETDLRPELGRIKAPTTLLYVQPTGAPLTEAQVDAMYKSLYAGKADAKLLRIPAANHFIMLDQPQRFQQEMKAFLGH